jgi:hypothetical protein
VTTKTKTTTHAEKVAASKIELADARHGQAAATVNLENAREAVAEMRQGRRAGDRSATPEDLATAQARVTLAEDDLTYAENRLAKAGRALLNDDISIADLVASALPNVKGFDAFDIIPTAETPTAPSTIGKPVLYLRQTAAPKHDAISGRSSGTVEATLYRPAWGRSLDVEDAPEALAKAEVYADVNSLGSVTLGEVVEDRARFTVNAAWQPVPVISEPNGGHRFGSLLAGQVARHLSIGRRGQALTPRFDGGLGSTSALSAAVSGQGESKMTGSTVAKGIRSTTVEVTLALASQTMGTGQMAKEFAEYLPTMVGSCAEGLGRIIEASIVPTGGAERHDDVLRMSVRATFTSRVAA